MSSQNDMLEYETEQSSMYLLGYFNTKMKLRANHPQSSDFEKNIVECLQKNVEEINRELRKVTDCKIVVVKSGSIVLHLLNCGPLLRKRKNLKDDIDKLLKVVFHHPSVVAFGGFSVTVEIPVQKSIEGHQISG